ncbi:MAG: indole-3-glycerol phosphate synthase TrpC [Candidatus Margulisiibacteriota bacterium]
MILDEIVFQKRREVEQLKERFTGIDPAALVEGLPCTRPFLKAFRKGRFSLIAEIKKASPSAGLIRPHFEPVTLAKTYEESGASAISVLTDEKYFQGKLDYLKAAKDSTTIPILRKDFIIDALQIYESRIAGADAVLLIARILDDLELAGMLELTESLGMQALVEIHNAEEAKRVLSTKAKVIGINNRDLDTLKIDLDNTSRLIKEFPSLTERIIISESGIANRADASLLKRVGVNGILVGETLMKSANIPAMVQELLSL